MAGGQEIRIDLRTHCIFGRPPYIDLCDSGNHRNALGYTVFRIVVERGKRHGRRIHRKNNDRLVSRIDLAESGRGRHAGGQQPLGRSDRNLDILSRGIQVAVERKLQRDISEPEGTRGSHGIDSRYRRELLFQRGRHRCRHHFRARARKTRAYLYGREIHIGKIANRKSPVPHNSENDDSHHDQRRHHGTSYKQFSNIHSQPSKNEPLTILLYDEYFKAFSHEGTRMIKPCVPIIKTVQDDEHVGCGRGRLGFCGQGDEGRT